MLTRTGPWLSSPMEEGRIKRGSSQQLSVHQEAGRRKDNRMSDFDRIEEILERIAVSVESIAANQSATPQTFASESKMSSRTAKLPEGMCRKEGDQFIWTIPEGAPEGKCRDCQGTIIWLRSKRGRPFLSILTDFLTWIRAPRGTNPKPLRRAHRTPQARAR